MKKKEANPGDKRKTLAIVEVQQALKDWYELRRNEITGTVEGRKTGETDFLEIREDNLIIQLLNNGYRISQGILAALLNSEFVPSYNPFKDYFAALPAWNANDRDYIEELANHVKAIEQKQFNHQFKKMLVRTIACAIDDNVFNKQAFILVGGAQHTGKSTFCRFLCPESLKNYYTESIPGEKDGLICLCENLFINLDELNSLPRFELNKLKTMFSIIRVRVRHPFARKSQTDFRRASFIGSTNDDTFLTDTTGSVRWLCFEIDSIVFDYEKIGIDNVWKQAYSLYKAGFKFQLTTDEIKENESRNEQYQQVSMEYEYVQMYLTPGSVSDFDAFWTTTQIRDYIITKSERKADIKNTDKLGKVLKQLGYVRLMKRIGDSKKPLRGFYVKYFD